MRTITLLLCILFGVATPSFSATHSDPGGALDAWLNSSSHSATTTYTTVPVKPMASYQWSTTVTTRSYSSYPVHRQIYNINGDWNPSRAKLISHLSSNSNHRGKFSRSYLESLSRAELLSLHDDDHMGRVRTSARQRSSTNRGVVGGTFTFLFGSCPNGRCPR